MNKKIIKAFAGICLAAAAMSLSGCGEKDSGGNFTIDIAGSYDNKIEGNGNLSSNTFELSADRTYKLVLSGISRSNSTFKAVIDPTGNNAVLEADENALVDLKLNVDENSGTITLSGTEGTMFSNVACTLTLNVPVNSISADGDTIIDYKTPENPDSVDITASGSVKITAAGSAEKAVYKLSGSASLSAGELKARDVDVDASGSVNCNVYAENSINVTASGSSSVTYSGDPDTANENASGMASINKK